VVAVTRYWHGGAPGLKAGDRILPPSVTGTAIRLYEGAKEIDPNASQRLDRVYVTVDRKAASVFARLHPLGGWLYLVDPDEPLEHDEDCNYVGYSFQTTGATIKAVYSR
jgi:hypothetical protein